MTDSLDPGALLARYYPLTRGPKVCLRLVRPRDLEGIRELLRDHAPGADELEPGRLVNFDLSRRLVLCATALVDHRERVVGVGAIELDAAAGTDEVPRPGLLVVDRERTEGLEPLLHDALTGQAAAIGRARAA